VLTSPYRLFACLPHILTLALLLLSAVRLDVPEPPGRVRVFLRVRTLGELRKDLVVGGRLDEAEMEETSSGLEKW
jgi:hypothetical protein